MKQLERDPFSLMSFHRVLIGTGICACIFYGVWEFYRNYTSDPNGVMLRAGISWVLAFALIAYLVSIRSKK